MTDYKTPCGPTPELGQKIPKGERHQIPRPEAKNMEESTRNGDIAEELTRPDKASPLSLQESLCGFHPSFIPQGAPDDPET